MIVVSSFFSLIKLRSIVAIGSPALTFCPFLIAIVNGFPLSPTVSTPIWTKTSSPSLLVMPTACLVSAIIEIVPLTGATT